MERHLILVLSALLGHCRPLLLINDLAWAA